MTPVTMNNTLRSLANAEWLAAPAVQRVFAMLTAVGEETRIAGGAVRNALMGLPVGEVDFATTATPDKVIAAAVKAGVNAVPTGLDHGTVTLVVGGTGFEVTTLRRDILTDGRHAIVRFGRDWEADARRRDFTINALSVDQNGAVHDPVGGLPDILARRVRFIGEPDKRIAEDRLRILRFFRFHAEVGEGDIDAAGLAAGTRAHEGLRELSAERIGQEMRRIVVASRAAETVALMQEAGVLPVVLGGVGYLAQFASAVRFEAEVGATPAVAPRLTVLACRIQEDVLRVSTRLRLANTERDGMISTLTAAASVAALRDARATRRLLYRLGVERFREGVVYAAAWNGAADFPPWLDLYRLPDRWTVPAFPLAGRDVLGHGTLRGPVVGELLRAVEAWWIDQDFAPDEAALRRRLQQMLASAQ
jgi:tRNA nucleotidyltransferase/poly(A) polymerase